MLVTGGGAVAAVVCGASVALVDPMKPLAVVLGLGALAWLMVVIRRDRIVGVALLGCLLVTMLVPVLRLEELFALRYVAPAAVLAMAGVAVMRRGVKGSGSSTLAVMLMYLVELAMATVAAHDKDQWRLLGFHAGIGILFLCLATKASTDERRLVVRGVLWFAAVAAVYGLYEMVAQPAPLLAHAAETPAGTPMALQSEILPSLTRAQATFGHPLPFAFMLLLATALVLGRAIQIRPPVRLGLVALLLAGIVASGSRSALIIAVVLVLFSLTRRSWLSAMVGVYAMFTIIVALAAFGFFSSRVVETFTDSGSVSHRLGAFDAAQRLWADQGTPTILFGNGFGSPQRLFEAGLLQTDGFTAVDDQLVLTLATGGLAALLLLIVWILLPFLKGEPQFRAAIMAGVGMFLSFDLLAWPSSFGLLAAVLGMALPRRASVGHDLVVDGAGVGGRAGVDGEAGAGGQGDRQLPQGAAGRLPAETHHR